VREDERQRWELAYRGGTEKSCVIVAEGKRESDKKWAKEENARENA
jgi:hypothetical protein